MANAFMTGARLAYVVVPQEGTVQRQVHLMKKDKNGSHKMVSEMREEPAGFMVYFPRGHVIRLRDRKELRRYKLDQKPNIISMEGLSDPNSPLGKLMMAENDDARLLAMSQLEQQVIRMTQVVGGKVELVREPELVMYGDDD